MVVGILFLFAPFNLHLLGIWKRLIVSLLFGASTVVFASIIVLPIHFIRDLKQWRPWKLWHEILLHISILLSIGFGNALCIWVLNANAIQSWESLMYVVLITAAFGIIPTLINSVYEQNQYLKKLQKLSALRLSLNQLNAVNSAKAPIEYVVDTDKKINIRNEKGETELRLKPEQLLYVASEGNYIDIYYLDCDNEVKRSVIRNRLKSLISSVDDDLLVAIHRSFAINILHLKQIEGNARAAKAYINAIDVGIPIARSKFAEIKNLMDDI